MWQGIIIIIFTTIARVYSSTLKVSLKVQNDKKQMKAACEGTPWPPREGTPSSLRPLRKFLWKMSARGKGL